MQQIMFIKEVLPMEQIQVTNQKGQPDVLKLQTYVLSDGINTIAGETVGNFTEAAQQLKLKVGGWVQVSLEFSVNDRKTQDGRDFKAQRVRILNISPLWGHEETADKCLTLKNVESKTTFYDGQNRRIRIVGVAGFSSEA